MILGSRKSLYVLIRLHVDQVAQVAEVGDFLQEDQLHGIAPDKLFVSEARAPQQRLSE